MASFADACERSTARVRQAELMVRKNVPSAPISLQSGGSQQQGIFGSRKGSADRRAYAQMRNWVYVCVNAVCRRVAGQSWGMGQITRSDPNPDEAAFAMPRVKAGRYHRNGLMKSLPASQELEVYLEHDLLDALNQPNPVQRKWEFLYVSAANLLLTGECYWIADWSKEDSRLLLWAVPTDWITPMHENGLFSAYRFSMSGVESIILPRENVARTYIPDPANIQSALSPLKAVSQSAKIDQAILDSQEQSFERGIYPNVVVTVGRVRGADGSLTDRRPVLTGNHRRQIVHAIREIWNQSVAAGDPAILDGLVESIHKLNSSPQEMDWQRSSELVKRRIMQAFGVNPITVGETENANRAQAVEAEKQTCATAVNPIVNALSETATSFLGPSYAKKSRIVIWIEPCEPIDPDLELRRWSAARRQGDVSRNEFRAEVLGLSPIGEENQRTPLLDTVGGMTGAVSILTAAGQGLIDRSSAAELLRLFFGLDQESAARITGADESELLEGDLLGQDDDDEDNEDVDEEQSDDDDEDGKFLTWDLLQRKLAKANPNHDEMGRFASGSGKRTRKQKATKQTKSEIAKASAKRTDREIQQYSEDHNETVLADKLGGSSLKNNEPADVVVDIEGETHGVELKTMVDNGNKKLTMKREAMDRKKTWEKEVNGTMHTVVFDDHAVKDAKGKGVHDQSKRVMYYRRGYGSFRVKNMYQVSSFAELKRLMSADPADLPEGAY